MVPISVKELEDYLLKVNPERFGVISWLNPVPISSTSPTVSKDVINFMNRYGYKNFICEFLESTTQKGQYRGNSICTIPGSIRLIRTLSKFDKAFQLEMVQHDLFIPDVITMYNILLRRPGCTESIARRVVDDTLLNVADTYPILERTFYYAVSCWAQNGNFLKSPGLFSAPRGNYIEQQLDGLIEETTMHMNDDLSWLHANYGLGSFGDLNDTIPELTSNRPFHQSIGLSLEPYNIKEAKECFGKDEWFERYILLMRGFVPLRSDVSWYKNDIGIRELFEW